jgi:hypothetical protein
LYRVYLSWYRGSASGRKPGGNPAKEPVLPWAYFKEGQLPKDLIARADSLKAGQCGFPYRSPYGYFLVRLEKSVPTPEVSFESAFLRLVFLATRDKYLEMDSVVEARAKDYYAANIAQFARPDTLELRAWLIPRQGTRSPGMTRHDVKPRVLSDTACYQALEIPSLALPAEVRVPLQERVRKDAAQAFFGPLSNRFGRWYFQVRSRKPAQGVLPFRLARKDILDRMTALPEEEGSGTASDEAQEEVGFNLALAQAYRQVQDRKRMEKEGQERHPEGGADLSHPDGRSDSKTADAGEPPSARIRREEAKRRADEDRMLKEARVDLNRLFR